MGNIPNDTCQITRTLALWLDLAIKKVKINSQFLRKIHLDYYVAAKNEQPWMKGHPNLWYLSTTIVSLGDIYLASIMILALRVKEKSTV